MIHKLAQATGLVEAIDERLHLLKIHVPYHESDHVLNIAYNALRKDGAWRTSNCDATTRRFLMRWGRIVFPIPLQRVTSVDASSRDITLSVCTKRSMWLG